MPPNRLDATQLASVMDAWPGDLCDLAMELRDFVLSAIPEVDERIAFHALFYVKPNMPFGVIGGNVCVIGVRKNQLQLGFLHGAFLRDPQHLLQGAGKAKRHIEIRDRKDIRPAAFEKLLRAAFAYNPSE